MCGQAPQSVPAGVLGPGDCQRCCLWTQTRWARGAGWVRLPHHAGLLTCPAAAGTGGALGSRGERPGPRVGQGPPELLGRLPDQSPGSHRCQQGMPGPLCERELGDPGGCPCQAQAPWNAGLSREEKWNFEFRIGSDAFSVRSMTVPSLFLLESRLFSVLSPLCLLILLSFHIFIEVNVTDSIMYKPFLILLS